MQKVIIRHNTMLSTRIPPALRSVLMRRVSPQSVARRSMSAHVWYRGALASLHHGETLPDTLPCEQASFGSVATMKKHENDGLFQDDSTDHITMLDAPETALGSIPLEEVVNTNKFQEKMVSWDFASSFLPTFSSMEQMQMVNAPETAIGSISQQEVLSDVSDNNETRTLHPQDKELISSTTSPLDSHQIMLTVDQPESALGTIALSEIVDMQALQQYEQPLPTTLQEYYECSASDERAMVVTSTQTPHAIVDVNDAWVGLCGYTRGQAVDKSLADLLQGKETNLNPNFMNQLSQGKEASTVVVNYDKNGRKFINKVTAGPLKNQDDVVTHFIGVLQEIQVDSHV